MTNVGCTGGTARGKRLSPGSRKEGDHHPLLDLPLGASPAQHPRADDIGTVHEPDGDGAGGMPPEDVSLAVPIDVPHARDGPDGGDCAEYRRARRREATDDPGCPRPAR